MSSVTYKNVAKKFGDQTIIKNLNIEVEDKEFLVLVGPSGCGKTTALRLLAGLEEVTEGEIIIGDRIVNDVAPKDRDIAMVFQSYALYPHLSVYDNLAFGLKLRKTPKEEIIRRVNEAAEILGITDLLERKPRQLSGGQRQRVAVGRAIVREPKVFLFDEPLSNLDAKLRVQMRAEISKLHQRLQTTFIYVTHDQTEAMTMATRIAVINKGNLLQLDTPQNLYDHPNNLFVAGFIGSPAMNFFPAKVAGSAGDAAAETAFARVPLGQRGDRILGKDIVIGLRPEDIDDITSHSQNGRFPVDAKVEVVEYLGNELQLYLAANEATFIARVPVDTQTKPGASLRVGFDLRKLHLFDRATEQAIR